MSVHLAIEEWWLNWLDSKKHPNKQGSIRWKLFTISYITQVTPWLTAWFYYNSFANYDSYDSYNNDLYYMFAAVAIWFISFLLRASQQIPSRRCQCKKSDDGLINVLLVTDLLIWFLDWSIWIMVFCAVPVSEKLLQANMFRLRVALLILLSVAIVFHWLMLAPLLTVACRDKRQRKKE